MSDRPRPDPDLPALLELAHPEGGPAVLLTPGARHSLRPGYLRAAVRRADPGAVAFVCAPAAARWAVRLRLRRVGLTVRMALLLAPRPERPRSVASLDAVAWAGRSLRRRAVTGLLRLPGGRVAAAELLPGVALVAVPRRAGPPFAWLQASASRPPVVRIEVDWAGMAKGATITAWRGSDPEVVAKVLPGAGEPLAVEAAALDVLAPGAAAAGVRVPRRPRLRTIGRCAALLQTPVAGAPVAELLAREPAALEPVLTELAQWLGRWHGVSGRREPLTARRLDELLLEPVAAVADALGPDGPAYRDWLLALATRLEGHEAPLVAVHHDLTTENVLWSAGAPPGVVDWATARPDGLPGMDFVYLAVDAVRAAARIDRPDAFSACFAPQGRYREIVQRLLDDIERGVPDAIRELALHACFLHHARNEHAGSAVRAGDDRAASPRGEFAEVLRRLARATCEARPA